MLILIAILLALIPALAIAYPFLRPGPSAEWQDDEGSTTQAALERRWDTALSTLRAAHLDHAIGNLTPADYRRLRRQCLRDAAAAMRAMHLEPEQEDAMLARLEAEGRRGRDGAG